VIDAIAEYELRYRDRTEEGEYSEEELLELLDSYLPDLVYAFDSKVPPPRERRGALALDKEYYEWRRITSGDPETRRAAAIRSYLATETERRGQFRISRSQNGSRPYKSATHGLARIEISASGNRWRSAPRAGSDITASPIQLVARTRIL